MTEATLSLEQDQANDSSVYDYNLDERILSIVQQCQKHEIRPARLAAELGISVEDACAELCGLLKAVGESSSFRFDGDVMVFTFPSDFQRKARRYRRRQTIKECVRSSLVVLVKVVKVVTAFGLILSLLIVTIAAMMGLVAAIIAMSRGGGHDGHRHELMRRLRSMSYTIRQLLWCYAMFGHNIQGQDPFLQEIAYDLALVTSVCCGNPGSIFFWLRASQFRNRHRRRGWAPHRYNRTNDLEGVALVRRGSWGTDEDDRASRTDAGEQPEAYRGLLSVAVEFLFGPTPFAPGPTEAEKWKMRGAVVVQLSSRDANSGVSLEELSPYVDNPPASLQHHGGIVTEGLSIVAHFNGRPLPKDSREQLSKARFMFPELMAESASITRYEEAPDPDDGSLEFMFYSGDHAAFVRNNIRSYDLPSSLQERRYVLTKLEKKQFLYCVLLGALNFIGVVWLRQSLEPSGVLDMSRMAGGILATFVLNGLMPVLHFYSILFFVLPLARLLLVVTLNAVRERKNRRRADFAHALKTGSSETQQTTSSMTI